MAPPTLHTGRLLLSPYAPADEDRFVALFQDGQVSRWMGGGPSSAAEDRALFRRIFRDRLLRGHLQATRRPGGRPRSPGPAAEE